MIEKQYGISSLVSAAGMKLLSSLVCVTMVLCFLLACNAPRMQPDIYSPAAVEKIPGIVQAADLHDQRNYPALVAALDSEDGSIRMFASQALYEITGTRKGYRSYEPPSQRLAGVQHWQQWLREQGLEPYEPPSQSSDNTKISGTKDAQASDTATHETSSIEIIAND